MTPLPQDQYTVESTSERFAISRRWYAPSAWALAAFVVIWDSVFLYATWESFRWGFESDWAMQFTGNTAVGLAYITVFFFPFGLGGALTTYYAFCLFFNKTVIEAAPEGLSVTAVPYTIGFYGLKDVKLTADEVEDVRIEEDYNETYDDAPSYTVKVETTDGTTHNLLRRLPSLEQAEYAVGKLEGALRGQTARQATAA